MTKQFSYLAGLVTAATLVATAGAQPSVVALSATSNLKLNGDGSRMVCTLNNQAAVMLFNAGTIAITNYGGQTGIGLSNDGTILYGNIQNLGINNTRPLTHTVAGRYSGGTWVDVPLFANPGLGTPNPPGTLSTAYDMSPDGRFATGLAYDAGAFNNARAFHYDALTNTTTLLPALTPMVTELGLSPARASGISDDGNVIVGFDQMSTRVPSVWTYDTGTSTWTQTILDTSVGELSGVSADGNVIFGTAGQFALQGAKWLKVGGVWTPTVIPTPDSPPAGATGTLTRLVPMASNADGSIIVGYGIYGNPPLPGGTNHAFIWSTTDGFKWLKDHLATLGAPGIAGFSLGAPLTISDNGRVIAGLGTGIGSAPWYVNLDGGFNSVPPAVTMQPVASMRVSLCDSFILNVAVIGSGPFTYQWHKGTPGNSVALTNVTTAWGSNYTGATTTQLRVNNRRPEDVGTYFCRITGAAGTIDSNLTVAAVDNTAHPLPPNDTCLTATEIGEAIATQVICQAWTNDGAASCQANSIADVWYKYTPSFTGEARIDTCGSNYNTAIAVFSSCGGTQIACNDTPEGGPVCAFNSSSRINRLPVTQNVPVWLRISSASGTASGPTLSLNIYQSPARPSNDACVGATPATSGLNFFDTQEASTDGPGPACRTQAGNDVWFSFTPNSPSGRGKLTLSSCAFTTVNTVIAVYASCGGPEIACNDNANVSPCFNQSTISNLQLNSNDTVYIRVMGNTNTVYGTGSFDLSYVNDPCISDIATSGNPDPNAGPDGFVTGADFDLYIDAFFNELRRSSNNTLIADLTDGAGTGGPDTFLTGSDFDLFIARFFSGC